MKLSIDILKSRCAMFFALTLLFFSFSANAAGVTPVIADTPCDASYYESMSARAWLEAQREITQNQSIILKPDSVFEYTCFDRLLRELADHAVEMLSETPLYGAPLSDTSMDEALQAVIGTSLITYINNNFGSKEVEPYNLLYGHRAADGITSPPRPITTAGAYSCGIMSRVWSAAKCMNFIAEPDHEGFYTFAEYATQTDDNRYLPYRLAAGGGCTPITPSWEANLDTALTLGPWTHDPVQTYFDITDAQDCAGGPCRCRTESGALSQHIPTGVRVLRSSYNNNDYEEHICLQPGCRYHPGGGDNLGTTGSDPGEGCYGR